jgi:nucleoside-diphosphate-sugar epimerase
MIISSVLINGGSGFFGNWMRRTQPSDINATYQTRAMYNDFGWTNGDWDAVIHLAPISPAIVLRYARVHNARVMYASSGAVYDRHDTYSDNKRKWEAECDKSGLDVVTVRPFCFCGEYLQLDRYSIGQFVKDGLKGGPVHYYDVGCIRSYMYGEDLGAWLWDMLLYGEGVYDVGSCIALTMRDVAETVAKECNTIAVPDLAPEAGKPLVYLPDTSRARYDLGLKETISLPEGIRRMVAWNRERMR